MDTELAMFVAHRAPLAPPEIVWRYDRQITATRYASQDCPPLAYISSVRAIVIRDGLVLTMRDRTGRQHLLPGGRREPGESLEATLRREVSEETGWHLAEPRLIGFAHYHMHGPQLARHVGLPYPDLVHLIYTAVATSWTPETRREDDYEVEAVLQPLAQVARLHLGQGDRLFLATALEQGHRELELR